VNTAFSSFPIFLHPISTTSRRVGSGFALYFVIFARVISVAWRVCAVHQVLCSNFWQIPTNSSNISNCTGGRTCHFCHFDLQRRLTGMPFVHPSLYFPYIHIQVKYQGCGNSQSYCKNVCQNCRCQIFKHNYNTLVT